MRVLYYILLPNLSPQIFQWESRDCRLNSGGTQQPRLSKEWEELCL